MLCTELKKHFGANGVLMGHGALFRNTWLLPVLGPLLPHVLTRLSADWARVVETSGTQAAAAAANGAHTSEAAAAAESEVIAERLLRELTAEHISLLTTLQDSGTRGVLLVAIHAHWITEEKHSGLKQTNNTLKQPFFPPKQHHMIRLEAIDAVVMMLMCFKRCILRRNALCIAGSGGIGGESAMAWLAREAPDSALCATVTATAALWWPDEIVGRAATFCRYTLALLISSGSGQVLN